LHAAELRLESKDEALTEAVKTDWRSADLSDLDRELCEFAVKLTKEPWEMKNSDTNRLRSLGLDDRGVTDVVEVVAYFNYINRIADGLGIDPEDWMK
jgi:uncharacterized peroxidase-related enzyme